MEDSTLLGDPHCPTEIWWELAGKYPIEAKASPLFGLLILESPERWKTVEEKHIATWIEEGIKRLSEKDQHLFAADCAEHVLHFFEKEYPEDMRPREAIRIRRLWALEKATKKEWETIAREVQLVFYVSVKSEFVARSACSLDVS